MYLYSDDIALSDGIDTGQGFGSKVNSLPYSC